MDTRYVYVECELWHGAFSGERVFEVKDKEGNIYAGVAPMHCCVKTDGKSLNAAEPGTGKSINGKVSARIVSNGGDKAQILVPDGETIFVSTSIISERKTGSAHVPIRS